MNCEPLADTGIDAPVLAVLTIAVLLLLTGAWCVLRAGRHRRNVAVSLLLVVFALGVGSVSGLVPSSPAYAAPADCSEAEAEADTVTTTEPRPASDPRPDPGLVEATASVVAPPADNSLTITQTSTMTGLAPGVDPADITGVVVNNGPDATFVTAIRVEIAAVTKRPGAVAGRCDASDYLLLDTRMAVGRTLAPDGGRTTFAGAAIGFNNKSSNQDACQGATIQLRYRTVPA